MTHPLFNSYLFIVGWLIPGVFADFAFEKVTLLETCRAPHRFAILEKDEGGNRTDVIFRSKTPVIVNVDFDNVCRITNICLYLFENRSLHFARPAPCGKEIYECRFRLFDNFREIAHNYKFFSRVDNLASYPRALIHIISAKGCDQPPQMPFRHLI